MLTVICGSSGFLLASPTWGASVGEAVFPSHLSRVSISHFRNSTQQRHMMTLPGAHLLRHGFSYYTIFFSCLKGNCLYFSWQVGMHPAPILTSTLKPALIQKTHDHTSLNAWKAKSHFSLFGCPMYLPVNMVINLRLSGLGDTNCYIL